LGSTRTRQVIAIALAAVVLMGCTSGSKSATPPDGSAVANGDFQATIRRTTDGVPHVVAADWGSRLIDLGDVGHLNPAAGYGEWPQAESMINALR
jgi:acyl-homoserine lactone acylase PvdQ